MSMASASAIADPIACPISSLQYGKCHFSGDSITPSSDTNSETITLLTANLLLLGCLGWYCGARWRGIHQKVDQGVEFCVARARRAPRASLGTAGPDFYGTTLPLHAPRARSHYLSDQRLYRLAVEGLPCRLPYAQTPLPKVRS